MCVFCDTVLLVNKVELGTAYTHSHPNKYSAADSPQHGTHKECGPVWITQLAFHETSLLSFCIPVLASRISGLLALSNPGTVHACSVVSYSLRAQGLQPSRLLCPWDIPCKITGVGCQFLLLGIFPTQGSNTHLHCRRFFTTEPPGKSSAQVHACVCAKLLPSCPTCCNSMDHSPPGCSVHGISQARILEWVALLPSRGSSQPWDRTCECCNSCTAGRFFTTEPLGKPSS